MLKPKLGSELTNRLEVAGKPSISTGNMYNTTRWRQERKQHLTAHPFCVMCEKDNIVRPAAILDHKIPHQGNPELFWDKNNRQGLCKWHHDSVKAREEHAQGYRA